MFDIPVEANELIVVVRAWIWTMNVSEMLGSSCYLLVGGLIAAPPFPAVSVCSMLPSSCPFCLCPCQVQIVFLLHISIFVLIFLKCLKMESRGISTAIKALKDQTSRQIRLKDVEILIYQFVLCIWTPWLITSFTVWFSKQARVRTEHWQSVQHELCLMCNTSGSLYDITVTLILIIEIIFHTHYWFVAYILLYMVYNDN